MAVFRVIDFDPFAFGAVQGGGWDETDVAIFGRADEADQELKIKI